MQKAFKVLSSTSPFLLSAKSLNLSKINSLLFITRGFCFMILQNFERHFCVFSAAVKLLFQSYEPLIESLYLLFFNFKVGTKPL